MTVELETEAGIGQPLLIACAPPRRLAALRGFSKSAQHGPQIPRDLEYHPSKTAMDGQPHS